jgi:hypothetical protein
MSSSIVDNYKMFGLFALVSGIIAVGASIWGDNMSGVVLGLALLVVGLLAYTGRIKGKVNIVQFYLIIYGIAYIVAGALQDNFLVVLTFVVIGIIAALIGFTLYSGKTSSNIWWIILVIVFVLLIVIGFLDIIDNDFGKLEGIVSAIGIVFSVVVNLYMLFFMLSNEVKKKFN